MLRKTATKKASCSPSKKSAVSAKSTPLKKQTTPKLSRALESLPNSRTGTPRKIAAVTPSKRTSAYNTPHKNYYEEDYFSEDTSRGSDDDFTSEDISDDDEDGFDVDDDDEDFDDVRQKPKKKKKKSGTANRTLTSGEKDYWGLETEAVQDNWRRMTSKLNLKCSIGDVQSSMSLRI